MELIFKLRVKTFVQIEIFQYQIVKERGQE